MKNDYLVSHIQCAVIRIKVIARKKNILPYSLVSYEVSISSKLSQSINDLRTSVFFSSLCVFSMIWQYLQHIYLFPFIESS